jgi:hypothetical protein
MIISLLWSFLILTTIHAVISVVASLLRFRLAEQRLGMLSPEGTKTVRHHRQSSVLPTPPLSLTQTSDPEVFSMSTEAIRVIVPEPVPELPDEKFNRRTQVYGRHRLPTGEAGVARPFSVAQDRRLRLKVLPLSDVTRPNHG